MINFIKKLIKKIFAKKELDNDWKNGAIESPQDYRDVPATAVSKKFQELPKEYNIPYYLRISSQGAKPHCVGYALATLKEEKERREQNFINFDGDWIYHECKKIDRIPNKRGTYLRVGLKILLNKGAKPLDKEEFEPYRIGGYVGVGTDVNSLKQAIYEYGVVLARFTGTSKGWRTAYIRPPKAGERRWGHAVAIVGYNENYIIGQNSWGDKRHDEGYFYFDKNYLPTETWAIISDLPNNWKELVGTDKVKPQYHFNENLWIGNNNSEVKALQECLKYKGCFPENVDCSGYFGKITLKAVKVFQERYGIKPRSGFVGPYTRQKLNEIF